MFPVSPTTHDDVIKWKNFPRYWPFVRGIHRSPVNSPHQGQWRGALMFSLICTWINGWVNNREAGDLRRHGAHHDITVMINIINHCLWFLFRDILRCSIIWPSTGLLRLVDPQHDGASQVTSFWRHGGVLCVVYLVKPHVSFCGCCIQHSGV